MKNKIFYVISILLITIILTGCGNKEAFTISCNSEKDNNNGIEIQNFYKYYFNDEQYLMNYSITTNQKFNDKNVYQEYKNAQEENMKSITDKTVTVNLKSNDDDLTLVYTMNINDIDAEDAQTEEEKNNLKAIAILSLQESKNLTCTVDGIQRNNLK